MEQETSPTNEFSQTAQECTHDLGRLYDVESVRKFVGELRAKSPNDLFRAIHTWDLDNPLMNRDTPASLERTARALEQDSIRRDINAMDENGRTALVHAICYGQFQAARMLVEAGADPVGDSRQSLVRNVFMRCHMQTGDAHFQFGEWLLEYIESKDMKERAIAQLSATLPVIYFLSCKKREQTVAIEMLLAFGVPPHEKRPTKSMLLVGSPLHNAARHGHLGVARALLDAGADIEARSLVYPCRTALSIAMDRGHDDMIILLQTRGAKMEHEVPGIKEE